MQQNRTKYEEGNENSTHSSGGTRAAVCGIELLKGINVFKSTNTYYVKFKDVAGLAVSNPVYANGYPVGIVRTIDYDYKRGEYVVVGIELDDEMRVPQQTRAELEAELMGGVKMTLVLGPNPVKNIEQGDTIQGGMHLGAMDRVGEMVPQIEKMLPKLDSIMDNLNRLTSDPALAATLHNAQAITSNLKQTSEKLNVLMQNDVPVMLASLKIPVPMPSALRANWRRLMCRPRSIVPMLRWPVPIVWPTSLAKCLRRSIQNSRARITHLDCS